MVIVAIESHQGALHMQISTIGLDIAKNVFQVHGIDAAEKVVVRKRLRRRQVLEFFKALPPCQISRRQSLMWWTAPAPNNEVPYGDRCDRITSGSPPHANFDDRLGYRQERVPGSRDRRG